MRKKNYKGRCDKRLINKCKLHCKTYDAIQAAYVEMLDKDPAVVEIQCNVPLDGEDVKEYMTDVVAIMSNGEIRVRECVFQNVLGKPMTMRLLDLSQSYWQRRGVTDWGLVVDAAEE